MQANRSLGVYLCHMGVLMVCRKALEAADLAGFLPSLLLWAVVLAASAALVAVCQRVLPKRVLSAVGFS